MTEIQNRFEKVFPDAKAALHDLHDGARIMSGGFGLCGNAENCIEAIAKSGKKDFTIISNNIGNQGQGLAVLLKKDMVKEAYCSFIGGNPDLAEKMQAGKVKVNLTPQGSLAEKIRAGGAGIGGFFTPTGVGTVVAEGKEERVLDGKRMILEEALTADFAIIRAKQADPYGNLRFNKTARNFSPGMAMAAKVTVVEAEELVPLGSLGPDDIHLPGIFVQRVFKGTNHKNPIEYRTITER